MSGVSSDVPRGSYAEVGQLAYPVVLSMLAQTVMGVVDTLFMGWVSTEAQAGLGLGSTLSWAVICFFVGSITAVNTLVAQHYGAGEGQQCGRVAWQGLALAGLSTLVVWSVGVPLATRLPALFGAHGPVGEIAGSYAAIRIAGGALGFMEIALTSFMRGVGDTRTPMKVALLMMALNVPLNYWLVFGGLGVPALGSDGAAYASVLANAVGVAILWAIFLHPRFRREYGTAWPGKGLGALGPLVRIGLPIGAHWVLEMGAWTIFTLVVARFGAVSLAAHNIVLQVIHLSFMPGVGLSVAATTLVGQAIGGRQPAAARRSGYASLVLAAIFMGGMALVFLLGGGAIAAVFTRDVAVRELATRLFLLAAIFQVFDGAGMVSGGVLRGAALTRFPMLVSLVCVLTLLLPGLWLFGVRLGGGVVGAWWAATLYIMSLGLVLFARVRFSRWELVAPSAVGQGQGSAAEE